MRYNLNAWMKRAAERKSCASDDGEQVTAGENLVIRPLSDTVSFVQLDDLTADQLDRVRPAAFMIHCTSPGSHQAWIALSDYAGDTAELPRRVRKALGAGDESATRATRLGGAENWKTKYLPEPPVVTITRRGAA